MSASDPHVFLRTRRWAHELADRLVSFARQSAQATAADKLAHDLGLPRDAVSGILARTAADLGRLASDTNAEARPIIDRAVQEISKLDPPARPAEEAIMERHLQGLSSGDYQVLRYFKQGKKHSEIAELLGTNVDVVRGSLVRTYAGLRMAIKGNATNQVPHESSVAQASRSLSSR